MKLSLINTMLLLLFASCVDDITAPVEVPEGGEAGVTLSVSLPAAVKVQVGAVRAAGDDDDIVALDILAFNGNAGATFAYRKKVSAEVLSTAVITGKVATIRLRLLVGDYNLVLIANARDEIDSYFNNPANDVTVGMDKTILLEGLTVSLPATTTMWPAASRGIPMWGESGKVTVSEGKDIGASPPVLLLRMMARIDVINSASGFTLTEANLYNYYSEGRVMPTATGTLTVTGSITAGPLNYTGVASGNLAGKIYAFESDATDANNVSAPTCLVIKGAYNNTQGYYRINFTKNNDTYLECLKRNYNYIVTIAAVDGPGYASKEQAYASRPVNIRYDIDVENMNGTISDGQYGLSVSEDNIELTRNATLSGIVVESSYDVTGYKGWAATSNDGWLHITDGNGLNPGSSVSLSARTGIFCYRADENTSGSIRFGSITVTSGRMTKTITITQNTYAYQASEADAANCYMVTPGGPAVKLPINASVEGETRSVVSPTLAGNTLQVGFLWTDCEYGLTNKSVVHRILIDGNTSTGNLIVIPGPASGNALISVTNASLGTIGWSWHIWNTDYNPGNKTSTSAENGEIHRYAGTAFTSGVYKSSCIMDRNLGATWTAADGLSIASTMTSSAVSPATAAGAYGMLYQWGRKDPFTPANGNATGGTSANNVKAVAIYNGTGTKLEEGGQDVTDAKGIKNIAAWLTGTSTDNLAIAIMNPMTFYYSSPAYNYDWWGNADSRNENLWGARSGYKSLYDPCPPGWKVPVSTSAVGTPSAAAYNPWAGFNGLGSDNVVNTTYNADGTATDSNNTPVNVTEGIIFRYYSQGVLPAGTNNLYSPVTAQATGGRLYTSGSVKAWYSSGGVRCYNGEGFSNVGVEGAVWSASVNNYYAYCLDFDYNDQKSEAYISPANGDRGRSYGHPVRCVRQ